MHKLKRLGAAPVRLLVFTLEWHMQRYLVNFFVYWYTVEVPVAFTKMYEQLLLLLEATKTLPMATNLTKPLYQDDSPFGRNLGFVIRLLWVWVGGVGCFVMFIPVAAYYLVYALLPLIALTLITLAVIAIL